MTPDERRQKAIALLDEARTLEPPPVPCWKFWAKRRDAYSTYSWSFREIPRMKVNAGDFAWARQHFLAHNDVWGLAAVATAEIRAGQRGKARETLELVERFRQKERKRGFHYYRNFCLLLLFSAYLDIEDFAQARQILEEVESEASKKLNTVRLFEALVFPRHESIVRHYHTLGDHSAVRRIFARAEELAQKPISKRLPFWRKESLNIPESHRFTWLAEFAYDLEMPEEAERFLAQVLDNERRDWLRSDFANLELERGNLEGMWCQVMLIDALENREMAFCSLAHKLAESGRATEAIRMVENCTSESTRFHALYQVAKIQLERIEKETWLELLAPSIDFIESSSALPRPYYKGSNKDDDLWKLVEIFSILGEDERADYFAAQISEVWREDHAWLHAVEILRSERALKQGDIATSIRFANAIPHIGGRAALLCRIAVQQFDEKTDDDALKSLRTATALAVESDTVEGRIHFSAAERVVELSRDALLSRGYISEWLKMLKTIPDSGKQWLELADATLHLARYGDPATANVFQALVGPGSQDFHCRLISCYAVAGRYAEAEQAARSIESREERGRAFLELVNIMNSHRTSGAMPKLGRAPHG